jgi:hypothetical protein
LSLLTICTNAANNIGIAAPSTIVGNSDPGARRLFQMARREGQVLSTRANWDALVVEHVFIADGTTNYVLPADFRSLINDTMWDRSRFWKMRGPMTPQQWQLYKSGIIGRALIERRWRIRIPSGAQAGATAKFSIDPQVGLTNVTGTFVYEYVSDAFVVSSTVFSARSFAEPIVLTDGHGNVLLDDNGNVLTANDLGGGTDYVKGELIDFVGGTFTTAARAMVINVNSVGGVTEAEIISPGGSYSVVPADPVAVTSVNGIGTGAFFSMVWGGSPKTDWTADSDVSVLDEDLIELGVIWRTMRRLGLAYDEELNEYNNQVSQAVARDGGTGTLSLVPINRLSLISPFQVQEGSFPGT